MWEVGHKESWVPKNWCFWTVVLEKTLESPLDCKEIQPVHPKGNQSWLFIGKTDAKAETPMLWPPDVKNWLIEKDPDTGKDWRWEEKGMTEDGWDGWMASSTQWTWVWVSSRSWWWTGNPGMLLSMGSQRVGHDWAAELETYMGFSGGSDSKDSACNVGAPNSILESRDSYNYMCAQNFLFSRSDMRYWDVIQMPCSLLVRHHWIATYVPVVLQKMRSNHLNLGSSSILQHWNVIYKWIYIMCLIFSHDVI